MLIKETERYKLHMSEDQSDIIVTLQDLALDTSYPLMYSKNTEFGHTWDSVKDSYVSMSMYDVVRNYKSIYKRV